jgi:hypothetical protein
MMKQTIAWVFTLVGLGMLFINGILMLFSPNRWFALPTYIALRGSMRPTLLATFAGQVFVRGLGLAFAAFALWVAVVVIGALQGSY